MLKRILSFVLSLALLVAMVPFSLSVSAADYSGKCGNNVYWEIEDGVLTISGTGKMTDYMYYFNSGPVWNPDFFSSNQLPFTQVVIEPGVTTIGENAFRGCNITSIRIPDTVTRIEEGAFCSVSGLADIRIPEGVTHVMREALSINGGNIYLPTTLEFVGPHAFAGYSNDIRNKVYFPLSESETLKNVQIMDKDHYSSYINMPYVNFIYDCGTTSIDGFFLSRRYDNFYNFVGDTRVFNSDSPTKTNYYDLLENRCGYEAGYAWSDFTWTSSNTSVLQIEQTNAKVPLFHGQSSGTATVTVTGKSGKSLSFEVVVIDPQQLSITSLYDTKQYYYEGGFYSAISSLSNSAEIYLEFKNQMNSSYLVGSTDAPTSFNNVKLTASVSGNDLSFSKENYQNTYMAQLGNIAQGKIASDLLSLYPVNPENYYIRSGGNPYTVTVTLESESFKKPVVQTYTFSILDAEEQKVKEHMDFALNDTYYQVSKENIYGKNMLAVKDDPDYRWSKWSTFDFENYYEVVMADILIQMLDVPQAEFSIVPKVLKDWYKSYDSLLEDIDKVVTDDCGDIFDVSETKIDKVLKTSKYRSADGDYVDDEFYLAVVDVLADEMNAGQIKEAFAKIDETKQVFELVSMVTDPIKEIVAWGNTLSVMNAFDEADQELKDVFTALANEIPSDEYLMKEAVLDYVNYTADFSGKVREIYDSFYEAAGKVTASSFENVVGKKIWDCLAIKAVEWIGTIPIKGGSTIASTSVYKTLTSASTKAIAGSVLTGASIGLTLSDLICSSSSKASEMGKLVAMCEYSPYIVNVLVKYEAGMVQKQDMRSVLLFEQAFKLHKAAQSYILNQTASALKVKADSILQKLLGNKEYYEVISDTLAKKRAVDAMSCCGTLSGESVVHTTKVLAVRCPVNVTVYKSNQIVAQIKEEAVVTCADDVQIFIRDGEKFIALPVDGDYSVEITAYGSGFMDYSVTEYDSSVNAIRTLQKLDIPITKAEKFSSTVHEEMDLAFDKYAIYSLAGKGEYIPVDPQVMKGRIVHHMFRMYDPNSGEHFYTGSTEERDNLVAAGWNYEGVGFTFPKNAGYPVYRLYEPVYGEHLYTMDVKEKDMLIAQGWNYEGIAFNSASEYEVVQYRLHNPNENRGAYHFTGSEEERQNLIRAGWEDQGIGWYSAWG